MEKKIEKKKSKKENLKIPSKMKLDFFFFFLV